MKLTVLLDNNTYIDRYYLGEPGVSYYIEDEGKRFLFDTGYSGVFLENAAALGCPMDRLDAIILSHGHNDHTGGLRYLSECLEGTKIVAMPEVFQPKECDGLSVGVPVAEEILSKRYSLSLSTEPQQLTERLVFLGQIPRVTDFENGPVGIRYCRGEWLPDRLPDESALMYRKDDGAYIITGCSHSGICNIVSYVRKLTGQKIKGVIGGFHLFDPDSEQARKTVEFLAGENIPELYPCHCTSFAARAALHSKSPVKEVGVGLTLQW